MADSHGLRKLGQSTGTLCKNGGGEIRKQKRDIICFFFFCHLPINDTCFEQLAELQDSWASFGYF